MGGVYKRKRMHNGHLRLRRRMRLKRKQKDLDEVSKIAESSLTLDWNWFFIYMVKFWQSRIIF